MSKFITIIFIAISATAATAMHSTSTPSPSATVPALVRYSFGDGSTAFGGWKAFSEIPGAFGDAIGTPITLPAPYDTTLDASEQADMQRMYQTAQEGAALAFSLPLPSKSSGLLRLHFAETSPAAEAGSRLFTIVVADQVVASFDIYAAANGTYIGTYLDFAVQSIPANGLPLTLTATANTARISGFEYFPGATPSSTNSPLSTAWPTFRPDTAITAVTHIPSASDTVNAAALSSKPPLAPGLVGYISLGAGIFILVILTAVAIGAALRRKSASQSGSELSRPFSPQRRGRRHGGEEGEEEVEEGLEEMTLNLYLTSSIPGLDSGHVSLPRAPPPPVESFTV